MTQYLSSCDGLISLCVSSSGFIHVGARVGVSSSSRLYTLLSNDSPHLHPFAYRCHLLAAAKHASVNTGVQMSLQDPACNSSGHKCRRKRTAGSHGGAIFHSLRNLRTVFHSSCTRSRAPPTAHQASHFCTPSLTHVTVIFLF